MTWGTYVHVPWCRRRCPYCAFYVEADRDVPWDRFVARVLDEYAWRQPALGGSPATLYLGGGTPSRMPAAPLHRLVAGIAPGAGAEITAETNPEDATGAWLDGARAAGVNRLSLGLQTFNPNFARLLNRACSVRAARAIAGEVARAGFTSWSVDVIFALPGQTLESLRVDLDAILEVEPPHVSLYGLTFEPGTPFERARDRGVLVAVEEDLWRDMYDLLVERLEAAGLARYEVSNFARPGHESRHNQLYWTDEPYLGLGPSAHGYLPNGARYANVADVVRYLDQPDPTAVSEDPDPHRVALDLVVSALRGRDGLDTAHLSARTGHALPDDAVEPLVRAGLLRRHGTRIALDRAGYPVADGVARHLADRLTPVTAAHLAKSTARD